MRPASALLLASVLLPLSLKAQTQQSFGVAGMEGLGTAKLSAVRQPASCPINFRAQHLADGSMVKTGAPASHGIGQRLHLTLAGKPGRRIVSAKVLVRGWTPQGRLERASSYPKRGGSDSGVRTLTARFVAGDDNTATAEIWAPGLTAVDSIEMLSVAYADGLTWAPGKDQVCRVTPDPLMLVAGR